MKGTLPFFRNRLKLTGLRRSALDVAAGRLVLMSAVFALLFIVVAARMVDLSLIQGPSADQAEMADNEADNGDTAPVRADIVDRNGVILATSLATPSLFADTTLIADPEKVARQLVGILPDLSYNDTVQSLKRKTHFVWIRRNLTPDEQFAVLKLGQPGLQFRTEYHRIYPEGALTSHIVGFTDIDGHGLAGIERSFNDRLNRGGAPVQLTLDVRLQHILRREMEKSIKTFSARGGAGVILDIQTGGILAAVSLPDFDPNNPPPPNDRSHFNMLTQGAYELGSTFKIFSVAAALDLKHLPLSYELDATKPLKAGRFTIHDFDAENRFLTIPEVFMYSSNIGAARLGELVGGPALEQFYKDLGLDTPMPLEIDEIAQPDFPKPWRDINTLTASFGHGIAVSPLQLVTAASAIADGGTLIHPTLILSKEKNQADDNGRPEVRVITAATSRKMRELLRLVVTKGTARQAAVQGYEIGGKTGTADKPSNGGYAKHRKLSSFLGFIPINKPRYAVYVLIDEPNGIARTHGYATGGWVGAPAVARVITAMAPLLGMPPHPADKQDDLAAPLYQYVHLTGGAGATY